MVFFLQSLDTVKQEHEIETFIDKKLNASFTISPTDANSWFTPKISEWKGHHNINLTNSFFYPIFRKTHFPRGKITLDTTLLRYVILYIIYE